VVSDFTNWSENSVHKGRIVIPAQFKAKFTAAAKNTVVCTVGPDCSSIAVYPLDAWLKLKQKLQSGTDDDQNMLDDLDDFKIIETLEGPGRIKLSDELLSFANITDSVIIKGEGSYMTLWNPSVFHESRSEKIATFKDKKYSKRKFQVN
jgi:DNA-binding transcriptional regulator/RsmH inhibitor MraZ